MIDIGDPSEEGGVMLVGPASQIVADQLSVHHAGRSGSSLSDEFIGGEVVVGKVSQGLKTTPEGIQTACSRDGGDDMGELGLSFLRVLEVR